MRGEEQVVDLVEYVNILSQRWKLIVSIVIIAMVIAVLSIVAQPAKYDFTMLLGTKGAPLSAAEVVESFNAGVYLSEVLKEFSMRYEELGLSVGAPSADIVKINAKTSVKDSSAVKEMFKRLYEKINELNEGKKEIRKKEWKKTLAMKKKQEVVANDKENKKIDLENRRIDLDIALINNNTKYYEGMIAVREKELAEMEQTRDSFKKEYEKAVKEKDEFVNNKEKILEEENRAKTELTVFYLSTVILDKRTKVYDLKVKLEDSEKYIKAIENEIKEFKNNIEKNKIEVNICKLRKLPKEKIVSEDDELPDFTDIQLIQEPVATQLRVNKKPVLLVSVVTGSMVGVVLAFLLEFVKRNKTI